MVKLELEISACKEGPYFTWNSSSDEYECTKTQKLIFSWDEPEYVMGWCPIPQINKLYTP